MMEHAKAIAGALTTLIVFVVAEIGLDLPDGVVAALGTVLTGVIVWRVTNRRPVPPPAVMEGGSSHMRTPRGGDDMGWKV